VNFFGYKRGKEKGKEGKEVRKFGRK